MAQSPTGTGIWSTLTDAKSNTFGLISGRVIVNGGTDTRTGNVVGIWIDSQGRCNQQNTAGGVWYHDGLNWVMVTAPSAPPPVVVPPPNPGGIGPTVRSDFLTIDYGLPQNYAGRSTQQIVDRRLWGVSTGGAGNDAFGPFTNPAYTGAAAAINPSLWRINGNIPTRGDSPYFNGDGTPNDRTWQRLIQNLPKVDPLGIAQVIIGVNIDGVIGFSDPGSYGRVMGNLARYLKAAKMPNGRAFPLLGFESHNEPDDPKDYPINRLAPFYNALWSAVKGVDPTLWCSGPVSAWAAHLMPEWLQAVSGCDLYNYHVYQGGYDPDPTKKTLPVPRWNTTKGQADIGAIAGLDLSKCKAIFCGEYNVDWNCQDPAQRTYEGAMWAATYLVQCLNGAPLPFLAAIWDAFGDGTCGCITDPACGIAPVGSLIGAGVRSIYGPRYQVTVNRNGLLVAATMPGATRASAIIVNGGKGEQTGQVALSRWPVNTSGNALANVWQLTANSQGDGAHSFSLASGGLMTLKVPDPSITILSI
jgi:hypothetical protein